MPIEYRITHVTAENSLRPDSRDGHYVVADDFLGAAFKVLKTADADHVALDIQEWKRGTERHLLTTAGVDSDAVTRTVWERLRERDTDYACPYALVGMTTYRQEQE